jgi:hypothetical protein
MGRTPQLPAGTPTEVNGWQYDPEPYNGNAWFDTTRETSVFVYPIAITDATAIWIQDERITDYNHIELVRTTYEHAIETAVSWMQRHPPRDWSHPLVCEAAFDPPPGWSLSTYSIGARQDTITYSRNTPPEDAHRQLLHVQGYRSTGTYEFGIVDLPTRHAKHLTDYPHESVPTGSSLEIALAMAFEKATTQTSSTSEYRPSSGQTTLNSFSAP